MNDAAGYEGGNEGSTYEAATNSDGANWRNNGGNDYSCGSDPAVNGITGT